MTEVNKGGVTSAGKTAKAAGPKLVGGNPEALRKRLAEEAEGQDKSVYFVGACDHLHLRPPKPIHDAKGNHIGMDPGVFIDFQGVGRTRGYDPDLADDAQFIENVREILEQKPVDRNVHKYKIRELKPEEPAAPFARWDTFSADHIKVWLTAALGADHEANALLVQQAAKYEAANENRDDVLAMLDALLATEAAVTDAFDVEIRLK